MAKEIAKDHLEEQRGAGEKQNYYDKLQKMEGKKHAAVINALVKLAGVGDLPDDPKPPGVINAMGRLLDRVLPPTSGQAILKRKKNGPILPEMGEVGGEVPSAQSYQTYLKQGPEPGAVLANGLAPQVDYQARPDPQKYVPTGHPYGYAQQKAKVANEIAAKIAGDARARRVGASAVKAMNAGTLTPQFAQTATNTDNKQHRVNALKGKTPGVIQRARVSNDPNHPMHGVEQTPIPLNQLMAMQQKFKPAPQDAPAPVAASPAALANKIAELSVQPEVGQPMPTKAQEKGQDKSESGEFRGTTNNVSSLTMANADLMQRSKDNIDARITELQQITAEEDPETGQPGELLPEEEEELHRLSNMSDGLNKLLRKRLYNIDEDLDHGQMEAVKDLLMAGSEGSYAEDGEPWTPELVEKAAYEIPWKPSGLGDKKEPPEKGRQREKEEERVTQTEKYREAKKLPRETVNPKSGVGSVEQRYSEGNGTIDEPTQVMPNKMGAESTRARAEVIVFTPKGVYGLRRGKHWLAFPGGGIEDGEDPVDAARREVVEEADLNLKDLKSLGTDTVTIPKDMRGKGKAGRNHARSKNHVFVAESAGKLKTQHKDRERFHVYDFGRAIEILTAALDDPEAAAFKSMNKKRVSAVQKAKQLAAAS